MLLEGTQILRHQNRHYSTFYTALQSECWKKENGLPPGAENPHGEIYHSQSRCFLANLTSQLLPGDKTSSHPSQIPHLKGTELTGRCYLHQCTQKGEYKVQVEGSSWVSCLPGKAIQVSTIKRKSYDTLPKRRKLGSACMVVLSSRFLNFTYLGSTGA